MKKLTFIIGRFQPFHKGHFALFKKAKENADKVVIFIGSSNSLKTRRNPYSYMERFCLIRSSISPIDLANVAILPLPDLNSDQKWVQYIEKSLESIAPSSEYSWNFVYTDKDSETSSNNLVVLNLLPGVVGVPNYPEKIINATDIREHIQKHQTVTDHPDLLLSTIEYMTSRGYINVLK